MAMQAIVRLIMSKGVQEAIKKHGAPAVREAKKHIDDFMKKPTAGQKAVGKATKSQRAARSKVRKAVVGTGAVGTVAAGAAYKAGQTSKDNTKRKNKVGSRTAKMLNTTPKGRVVSSTKLDNRKKK